ncbi:MAG TPA: aromatic amino acid ammonia-lyase [Steroidobacteraceae bacterium]|jgi:histidine ammonia-lyase|nr:aromatic amino acid ammonia-lyase [Steroidobacteraceae bacterium]
MRLHIIRSAAGALRRIFRTAALCAAPVMLSGLAWAGSAYTPIVPTMGDRTITLTGHDLTIDDIVAVARHGAKVELGAEARRREADNYGLLLEAAAEGVPVYWFNRGAGEQRETIMFQGDPMSAKNHALIEERQLATFREGVLWGTGPEVSDEEIVRAMMVVRANAMTFNAPSPQLAQMLLDFLNKRITPVVQSRGTLGEGDLAPLGNVGAAMVGAGDAYLDGVRMSAAQALERAGLKPIKPFAADDNALTSSNAYATGQAALVVHDARAALEWADIIYAIDLNGMNSSVTPLSLPVQRDRPERWLNWHAARMLDMLKGSYLFGADAHRIIQDPESLRASSIRQAAAWEAWSALKDAVVLQANASDHNPAVAVGVSPQDSWELATPQLMHFYVKGGPHSHGEHGYIVSNANWDPYPMANQIEDFVIALGNMDIAVALRSERFRNPFFTGVRLREVLPDASVGFTDYAPVDLMQEVQSLMTPIAPSGSAIVATVEDLQAQTRIKVQRARRAVATTFDLLGYDLLEGSLWLDVRKRQDAQRAFGPAATAAWTAFRQTVPLNPGASEARSTPVATVIGNFLRSRPASEFYPLDQSSLPRFSATLGGQVSMQRSWP